MLFLYLFICANLKWQYIWVTCYNTLYGPFFTSGQFVTSLFELILTSKILGWPEEKVIFVVLHDVQLYLYESLACCCTQSAVCEVETLNVKSINPL